FAPALRWIGRTLAGSPSHLGLLVVILALLAWRAAEGRDRGEVRGAWPGSGWGSVTMAPRLVPAPLGVALGAALGYLWAERVLDVSLLGAALFGLGSYGLWGLYVDGGRWRRGLPAALLLIGALPFGEQADTYAGFALRALTAQSVGRVLTALGIAALPAETILVLENGVAHVDVPCSGLRSLWAGALFFLGATWMERRRLDGGWLGCGVVFGLLLLGANGARVTAIVLLAVVAGQRKVAEVLHAPLGLIGFAAACAITLALLRWSRPAVAPEGREGRREGGQRGTREGRRRPGLAVWLGVLGFVGAAGHVRRPLPPAPGAVPRLVLPEDVVTEPLPLTAIEEDLFRRFGGQADKRRFRWRGHEGSLLVVYSRSWRAHHVPEFCLASNGVRVDRLERVEIDGGRVRWATLDAGRRGAVYWFQAPGRMTDDMLGRIWGEVWGGERRWAEVVLLFDEPLGKAALLDAGSSVREFVERVRQAAAPGIYEELR
ncbi:MAG TPA: exosortase O, partial [Polyangia bacterium]|nr:exosortase O [Polyangia bacterium]